MSDDLNTGTTRLAHARELLDRAAAAVEDARCAIHPLRRLTKPEREELSRRLAGAVGACEGVRVWLAAGAPR